MDCYEFLDRIRPGIRLANRPVPHVPPYPSQDAPGHALALHDDIVAFVREMIEHLPEDELVLRSADVRVTSCRVVFTPPRNASDGQALVRVQTWSGAGGKIELGGPAKDAAFPPPGVGVLLAGRVRAESAEILDTLLVLSEGSAFRIVRTGDLEGAWSEIRIQWDGLRLTAKELA
jgi:hypothetical protein